MFVILVHDCTVLSFSSPLASSYFFSSFTLHFIVFFIKVFRQVLPVPAQLINGNRRVSKLLRSHYLLTSVFPVQVLYQHLCHHSFFPMNNFVILHWGFETKCFCVIETPMEPNENLILQVTCFCISGGVNQH